MKNENEKIEGKNKTFLKRNLLILFLFLSLGLILNIIDAANPDGVSSIDISANETKTATAGYTLNTSGGYITTFNITASLQNPRWKAFVGLVSGTFTLDDASGSTIYDWSLATTSGEIYATRNSSTISWADIQCANTTLMENENYLMNHSNAQDNITSTFNDSTHTSFVVASTTINSNSCPTLNTYQNSATQDAEFEEMILSDSTNFTLGGNLIYSTIIENTTLGFDGNSYDFQMLIPENGAAGFSSSTAYYLYVELS